jgi:hypothetical protein
MDLYCKFHVYINCPMSFEENPIPEFTLLPFCLLLMYNHEVANGKSSLKVEFLYE